MAPQKAWYIFCAFSVYAGHYFAHGVQTWAEEEALLTMLQTGYSTNVKPETPTIINIFYSLATVQELDITEQMMISGGWISVYWTDPRLVWNASDYANISALDVNWVWRPVFMIANSADDYTYGGFDNKELLIRLHSDGSVRWILPLHLFTMCDVSIKRFPYDSQACTIEILFNGLNGVDVVANAVREIDLAAYVPSQEWQYDRGYLAIEGHLPTCCPVTVYQRIHVYFQFTRLRPFYVINLIIPSVALSFCMVLVFLLPTDSGERLGYSLTILLSYTVVMTLTAELMPTTSKEIPIIGTYVLILFLMCVISNFNVVINVKMYHLQNEPPKWLQIMALKLGLILFLKCHRKDQVRPVTTGNTNDKTLIDNNLQPEKSRLGFDTEIQGSSSDDGTGNGSATWQQIADVSDRLCFYVYSFAVVLGLILFCLDIEGHFGQ